MNSLNSENKQHYKMYKSGKQWIYAAITTTAVVAGTSFFVSHTVTADTTTQPAVSAPVTEQPTSQSVDVTTPKQDTTTNSDVKTNVDIPASTTSDKKVINVDNAKNGTSSNLVKDTKNPNVSASDVKTSNTNSDKNDVKNIKIIDKDIKTTSDDKTATSENSKKSTQDSEIKLNTNNSDFVSSNLLENNTDKNNSSSQRFDVNTKSSNVYSGSTGDANDVNIVNPDKLSNGETVDHDSSSKPDINSNPDVNSNPNDDAILPFDPTKATTAQAGEEFSKYRQEYHYSDPEGAGNDVQTIWKDANNLWHFYYLHSDTNADGKDYYTQNGWYHTTSSDLIHFQNCGTAIPGKIDGKWDASWTGSIITNENGFYKDLPQANNVLIAAISTPGLDVPGQNIWLLKSLDGGYNFNLLVDHPISGLPQAAYGYYDDNRDPSLWYNSETNQMEIFLAQGWNGNTSHGVAQYASDDGINFHQIGLTELAGENAAFVKETLIETPGISRLYDQTTGKSKDVMFIGIQNWPAGQNYNLVNGEGCLAILGRVNDQGVFIADGSIQDPNDSQKMIITDKSSIFKTDYGADYYGGTNQYNPNPLSNVMNSTLQNGWLGNWSYSTEEVKNGNPIAVPGVATFREVYLDNGVIKERWVGLDGSEWRDSKLVKSNVDANDGTVTISKDQSLAQTYDFNFTGIDNPNFKAQINFEETDGAQHIMLYRSTDGMRLAYWRDGGTFTGETSKWYSLVYDVTGFDLINQLNIRTDTQSLEIELPQVGKIYTILRYTLSPVQNVTVTMKGDNSKLAYVTSKTYVGNPNMQVTATVQYYKQGTNEIVKTATYNGKPGDSINLMYNLPDGFYYISGNQTYILQRDFKQNFVVIVSTTAPTPENQPEIVHVHYIDNNGNEVTSEQTITSDGMINIGNGDMVKAVDGAKYGDEVVSVIKGSDGSVNIYLEREANKNQKSANGYEINNGIQSNDLKNKSVTSASFKTDNSYSAVTISDPASVQQTRAEYHQQNKKNMLPQTGQNADASIMAIIGSIMLGLFGLFGLGKRRN